MKALITGASSGIGQEIALYLSELGYDLILVSRSDKSLRNLQRLIKTKCEVVSMDLTDRENVWRLHEMYKNDPGVELLVNNAGFGVFGDVDTTDLQKDLELIDLNITAVFMLTKLFLADMKKRNFGYILNVSSIAGFMDGPLMALLRISYCLSQELFILSLRKKSLMFILVFYVPDLQILILIMLLELDLMLSLIVQILLLSMVLISSLMRNLLLFLVLE